MAAEISAAQLKKDKECPNSKVDSLNPYRVDMTDPKQVMTSNQGIPIADNQNSLTAGARGPSLLEDFLLREKITHFDHERIPERVVHARGSGAFGYFQAYDNYSDLTKAKFLQDKNIKTPVFVRFSTVAGSRGSADTVRDVRGFAVKFYTEEGNFDLVGNNIPVFFVQDSIKFPDFVHAVKPEPHNEIPQASSAHDNLWDFVAEQTETMHMVMWLMSDRAIPRSYSTMEGFGVHSFRLIAADGSSRFVKFHWKPVKGIHSLVWDEAQKLSGQDPDFHRRDLWDSIEDGNFPEFELGVQVIEEGDEFKFDFDILDATKIVPEELVPVRKLGKLVLNKNPDNFFAETEQVAFCISNIVPGIDFTNDPLLQGRLFSYLDTQLTRLGGPNFHEIPINRPICPFHPRNNNRDGFHRQTINIGKTNYDINSINKGLPKEAGKEKGFTSYPEKMLGDKVRERPNSFAEHFQQATLFWKSMTPVEQAHIVSAFSFELSKVNIVAIREKVVGHLQNVDSGLASRVAVKLGLKSGGHADKGYPKQANASPALSQLAVIVPFLKGRQVAVVTADGGDGAAIKEMKSYLESQGMKVKIVAPHVGAIQGVDLDADESFLTAPSVAFDAVYVAGGEAAVAKLLTLGKAIHFVLEAFKHYKPIAASGAGKVFLEKIGVLAREDVKPSGVVVLEAERINAEFQQTFVKNIGVGRFFDRQRAEAIPA